MLNTVKLALAATVAAATGTLASFADDAIPKPAATPLAPFQLASDNLVNPFAKFIVEAPQEKRVTARITGTIEDVVKWMGDNGISFVLENRALSTRKVTVNIVNQPVDDAIAAIADALGTSWTKRGQVYVLGGQDAFAPRVFAAPGSTKKIQPLSPQQKAMIEAQTKRAQELSKKALEKSIAPRIFSFEVPTPPGLSDKDRKEFEQQMKKLREELKGLDVRIYTDMKGLSETERKAMDEALKNLKNHLSIRDYRQMTPEEQKRFDEAMRKLEIDMRKLGDDFKVYTVPPMRPGQVKESAAPRAPLILKAASMDELLKSLTPDQKVKHEQQGFLKYSDLSGAQKKMLGSPSGNFTISFNLDGRKLTIKNP